ncbi:MAG: hypothetical protein ACE361_01605 [Aureliella sp.]
MSSKSYCPRRLLRVVSNGLLQDMFDLLCIEIDVEWDSVTETRIEPVFIAWQSLDDEPRRKVELLLREVDSMASEVGLRAIFEEAHRQGETELIEELSQYDSRYDVAMWTALKKANVWETAMLLNRADRKLGGRFSQRRINVPVTAKPNGSAETMRSLSKSLSAFFTLRQGRGRNCECEYLLRSDGTHYVFATLDDYRRQYLRLVDGGGFAKSCETPAFEVIFAFDEKNRTLDIDARGGKSVHQPLQSIIAREFLGINLPPEDPRSQPFMLDVLLDPTFRFPTDPADGICSLCVEEAGVRVLGTKDRMNLKPGSREEPTNFSEMVEKYFDDAKVPRSVMQVLRAVLLFSVEDSDGRVRDFDVRITQPNRSNLKSLSQDERELAEKYLREWGIDCAIASDAVVAAA